MRKLLSLYTERTPHLLITQPTTSLSRAKYMCTQKETRLLPLGLNTCSHIVLTHMAIDMCSNRMNMNHTRICMQCGCNVNFCRCKIAAMGAPALSFEGGHATTIKRFWVHKASLICCWSLSPTLCTSMPMCRDLHACVCAQALMCGGRTYVRAYINEHLCVCVTVRDVSARARACLSVSG